MVKGRFIWDQFEKLIARGFHEAAGFSKDEFTRLVPEPKQEDALLVVSETCVGIQMQANLLEVAVFLESGKYNLNDHRNIMPVPRGLLYWRYGVSDGKEMLKHSTADALKYFKLHRKVACVTVEVLAIYREHPDVVVPKKEDRNKTEKRVHNIDAAGSRIGHHITGLGFDEVEKRPVLMINNPDVGASQRWGAAFADFEEVQSEEDE